MSRRAPETVSLRSRLAVWGSTAAALIGGATAGLVAAIGVFELSALPTSLLAILGGLAGTFGSLAITEPDHRVRHLVSALACAVAFPIVLGVYVAFQDDGPVELVVDDGESDVVYGVGEPGGDTIVIPINRGTTALFTCRTQVEGHAWYRLSQYPVAWLPGSAVRPRAGGAMPSIAEC